jgi:phosphotriesterase-related protein
MRLNTVGGPIDSAELGRTLIHEHAVVAMPGWETDTLTPPPPFDDLVRGCVSRIKQLQEAGFQSMVDPCPSDLGRNVDLLKAIYDQTGFTIIFATGLYHEHAGGAAYWRLAFQVDPEADKRLSDVFISEVENGVGASGLKPGVFKVGITGPDITAYERKVVTAVARASAATGIPVISHTEGALGPELVALFTDEGLPADRIMVGHSDENPDTGYHASVLDTDAYIGFDRFGNTHAVSDEQRVHALRAIVDGNRLGKALVSSDSVWHWGGAPFSPEILTYLQQHFADGFNRVPRLLADTGFTTAELDTIFVDNPRHFLEAGRATNSE